MMPENRSTFSCFPENHWVVSLIVDAFHTTTFFLLGVYIKRKKINFLNANEIYIL